MAIIGFVYEYVFTKICLLPTQEQNIQDLNHGKCTSAKKWLINKKKVGKFAHLRKLPIMAVILHSKQQKSYQGEHGTQGLALIGSNTSLGPSMDPTGPLKLT